MTFQGVEADLEDARAYAVKLTDEGWRALKATDPVARRVDDKILAVLPSNQRERFVQDLNTIVQSIGKLAPVDRINKN